MRDEAEFERRCAEAGVDVDELRRRVAEAAVPHDRVALTDPASTIAAIQEFEAALPGWWWSLGHCQLTRDASCGPDFRVLGNRHPHVTAFDSGFHDDHPGTLADALRSVLAQALAAIAEKDGTAC